VFAETAVFRSASGLGCWLVVATAQPVRSLEWLGNKNQIQKKWATCPLYLSSTNSFAEAPVFGFAFGLCCFLVEADYTISAINQHRQISVVLRRT
jgi:hypothetical protein